MNLDVECSRCGFKVYGTSDNYHIRKKRHVEGRHTAHKVISERDGLPVYGYGMGNLDIGKVDWITVW